MWLLCSSLRLKFNENKPFVLRSHAHRIHWHIIILSAAHIPVLAVEAMRTAAHVSRQLNIFIDFASLLMSVTSWNIKITIKFNGYLTNQPMGHGFRQKTLAFLLWIFFQKLHIKIYFPNFVLTNVTTVFKFTREIYGKQTFVLWRAKWGIVCTHIPVLAIDAMRTTSNRTHLDYDVVRVSRYIGFVLVLMQLHRFWKITRYQSKTQ